MRKHKYKFSTLTNESVFALYPQSCRVGLLVNTEPQNQHALTFGCKNKKLHQLTTFYDFSSEHLEETKYCQERRKKKNPTQINKSKCVAGHVAGRAEDQPSVHQKPAAAAQPCNKMPPKRHWLHARDLQKSSRISVKERSVFTLAFPPKIICNNPERDES